jgi:hypothetical protein
MSTVAFACQRSSGATTHYARHPCRSTQTSRWVPLEEYRDEIVAFARRAKVPFEGMTKSFGDDFDREMFVEFWEEYDRLLADAVAASEP